MTVVFASLIELVLNGLAGAQNAEGRIFHHQDFQSGKQKENNPPVLKLNPTAAPFQIFRIIFLAHKIIGNSKITDGLQLITGCHFDIFYRYGIFISGQNTFGMSQIFTSLLIKVRLQFHGLFKTRYRLLRFPSL